MKKKINFALIFAAISTVSNAQEINKSIAVEMHSVQPRKLIEDEVFWMHMGFSNSSTNPVAFHAAASGIKGFPEATAARKNYHLFTLVLNGTNVVDITTLDKTDVVDATNLMVSVYGNFMKADVALGNEPKHIEIAPPLHYGLFPLDASWKIEGTGTVASANGEAVSDSYFIGGLDVTNVLPSASEMKGVGVGFKFTPHAGHTLTIVAQPPDTIDGQSQCVISAQTNLYVAKDGWTTQWRDRASELAVWMLIVGVIVIALEILILSAISKRS